MSSHLISFSEVDSFLDKCHGLVRFATAPDGLPWVLAVDPPPKAESLLAPIATALGVEGPSSRLSNTPLRPIVDDLDRMLQDQLLQELSRSDGEPIAAMVLPRLVRLITGETLLSRLLSGRSFGDENGFAPSATAGPSLQTCTNVSVLEMEAGPSGLPMPKFRLGTFKVALVGDGGPLAIVRQDIGPGGWPEFSFVRSFREESFACFRSHRTSTSQNDEEENLTFIARFHEAGRWLEETIDPGVRGAYDSTRIRMPSASYHCRVSRNAMARIMVDVALDLARLHATGEVHGDLKPSNVLILEKGAVVFDSLGLEPGVRSPAMTKGWAAPEQILAHPVGFQTDQYAFGLLLLQLLQGVLYGEESPVRIPIGGRRLETHTLLRNPGAFIDPTDSPVEYSAVEEWRAIIERCIRFEPTERFSAMMPLIDSLKHLVEKRSLKGYLEMPLSFGTPQLAQSEAGMITPCWLVS